MQPAVGVPPADGPGELAIRRLLLIPHLPSSSSGAETAVAPIIQTMRALSPIRRGSPRRGNPHPSLISRGREISDSSMVARSSTPTRLPGQSLASALSRRNDSPVRGVVNTTNGSILGFMGPPQLQLSKGVASSLSVYQPRGGDLDITPQSSRQLDFSAGGDLGVSHYEFLTGKEDTVSFADERPPTPMTPSMLRIVSRGGTPPPVAHRYLIGKEGERALRETPLLNALIERAKTVSDREVTSTATHKLLIQRGPEDWFRRRAAHHKVRFRISTPQLLMFPFLFPMVSSATTYAPSKGPMLSLSSLICDTTADSLIQLVATAVREQVVSPALETVGARGLGGTSTIFSSLNSGSRRSSVSGPTGGALEEQVLSPFRPLMKSLEHEHACDSLVVAWPLETPEASAISSHSSDCASQNETKVFPTKSTHTILYLQGPHLLSTFPLISAWSRSMLLNRERSGVSIVDIFLIFRDHVSSQPV